jgi:hypothetical protein
MLSTSKLFQQLQLYTFPILSPRMLKELTSRIRGEGISWEENRTGFVVTKTVEGVVWALKWDLKQGRFIEIKANSKTVPLSDIVLKALTEDTDIGVILSSIVQVSTEESESIHTEKPTKSGMSDSHAQDEFFQTAGLSVDEKIVTPEPKLPKENDREFDYFSEIRNDPEQLKIIEANLVKDILKLSNSIESSMDYIASLLNPKDEKQRQKALELKEIQLVGDINIDGKPYTMFEDTLFWYQKDIKKSIKILKNLTRYSLENNLLEVQKVALKYCMKYD